MLIKGDLFSWAVFRYFSNITCHTWGAEKLSNCKCYGDQHEKAEGRKGHFSPGGPSGASLLRFYTDFMLDCSHSHTMFDIKAIMHHQIFKIFHN